MMAVLDLVSLVCGNLASALSAVIAYAGRACWLCQRRIVALVEAGAGSPHLYSGGWMFGAGEVAEFPFLVMVVALGSTHPRSLLNS